MKAKELIVSLVYNDKGKVIGEKYHGELIRCKDCKYYRGYAGVVDGYCYMAEWYKRYQYPDDFCSRAERKEE